MSLQAKDYKRFYIKTLGCKVNQYESQAMREILLNAGFKECLTEGIADIFIINTCTVTNHADKESRRLIALAHKVNPKAKIVITGCYADSDPGELSFLPGVSNIVRNDQKGGIARILEVRGEGGHPSTSLGTGGSWVKGQEEAESFLKITDFKGHTKAFVKIQDGCENLCSYCKVPLVRSAVRSKPLLDVLEEVGGLVANGFKEIVLTGICLGAWGRDLAQERRLTLVDLLKEFDRITGDFRVRLSSLEPKDVTDELIEFIASSRMMCRHLHIPMQSGDDVVLKAMNRPYTAKEYVSLINKVKSRIKDVGVTTDVLIGFPGEGYDNFRSTLSVIKRIVPLRTHIFTFSPRKGTPAYDMQGKAESGRLKKWYYEMKAASLGASYLYRMRFLKERLDVLVETKRDKMTGLLKGYSDNYIKVFFDGGDSLMREIVPVRIEYLNLMYTFGSYAE